MPYHQVKCRVLTSNSLEGDEEKNHNDCFSHFSPLPLLILNKYYTVYYVSNREKEGGTKHIFFYYILERKNDDSEMTMSHLSLRHREHSFQA